MTKRAVRVALLMCDTPVPAVVAEYGIYSAIYKQWLLKSLETYPDEAIAKNTELVLDAYDVVNKQEYPSVERLRADAADGYDAVMLTGSKHSAYDDSQPWITNLIQFVSDIASEPDLAHLKLLGICFGHQVISIALGGRCEKGHNGWELGVYGCEMTEEGKKLFAWPVEGHGHGGERVYLEQVHKDHVPTVPPGCHITLSTPRYPVHGYVRYHPSSDSSVQVFAVQGHPEFIPDMVLRTVEARVHMGIFDDEVATEARRRAVGKGDGGEGFGRVGWTVWRVLLQPGPSSA
ncbi:hypothetical protein IAU60_005770 [Kwoniella sp. DSM 27419]